MSFNDPLADPLVFGDQDKVCSSVSVFVTGHEACTLTRCHVAVLMHATAVALQDLADLADLSLDPALVDDHGQAAASDPFASLASETKQDGAYTYGQLVTPPAPVQAAPSSSDATTATTSATAAAGMPEAPGAVTPPTAPLQAGQPDPFAGLQGSMLSSSQPDIQQAQQFSQQPGMQDLISADTSTPRLLSPEPPAIQDLPLYITVSEPTKREAAGMLGMKGMHSCLPKSRCSRDGSSVRCNLPCMQQ